MAARGRLSRLSIVFFKSPSPSFPSPSRPFLPSQFAPVSEKMNPSPATSRPLSGSSFSDRVTPLRYQLQNECVLVLRRGDITKWSVNGETDAIVNAANQRMLGGGGVDGAIHRSAGNELYEACLALPLVGNGIRCQTGDAVITNGFKLPVAKIIHTVGPIYRDKETSRPLLKNAYKNSLLLAVKNGIKYLAFPAVSCGVYSYPYHEAAEIALNTVNEFSTGLKEVHFILFEEDCWVEWKSKAERSFGMCNRNNKD